MLSYLINEIKKIIDNDSIIVESGSDKYPDIYEIWVQLDLQQIKIYDIYNISDKIHNKIKTINKNVYSSGDAGTHLYLVFNQKFLQRKFKMKRINENT